MLKTICRQSFSEHAFEQVGQSPGFWIEPLDRRVYRLSKFLNLLTSERWPGDSATTKSVTGLMLYAAIGYK